MMEIQHHRELVAERVRILWSNVRVQIRLHSKIFEGLIV